MRFYCRRVPTPNTRIHTHTHIHTHLRAHSPIYIYTHIQRDIDALLKIETLHCSTTSPTIQSAIQCIHFNLIAFCLHLNRRLVYLLICLFDISSFFPQHSHKRAACNRLQLPQCGKYIGGENDASLMFSYFDCSSMSRKCIGCVACESKGESRKGCRAYEWCGFFCCCCYFTCSMHCSLELWYCL